jgi:hypothetical protein
MTSRQLGDHGITEQVRLRRQRAPRLRHHTEAGGDVAQPLLGEVRVQFDLVDRWRRPGRLNHGSEMVRLEVGHADRPHPALCEQPVQRAPGLGEQAAGRHWPMDQVQIEIAEAEPPQAGVEGPQRLVVAVVLVPQLGGNEQFVTRHSGRPERSAHAGLVLVSRGCVDAAVPAVERGDDRIGDRVVGHEEYPESQLGHEHAIVQHDLRDCPGLRGVPRLLGSCELIASGEWGR